MAEFSLSVIIPARNEERSIEAALRSVVERTRDAANVEAVVVDNGSSDGTRSAVARFCAQNPGQAVTLVGHQPPGVAGAKNRGATAARGTLLLFLDADSRMAPDLAACVLRRAGAGYPAGSIRIVADSTDRLDRAFFALIEFGKARFQIRAQMFYCDRNIFLSLGGFDERLKIAEDREFLLRLQQAGVPVCHLRESTIATSPRRLHSRPGRLGMLTMLTRWALANKGIGRTWKY